MGRIKQPENCSDCGHHLKYGDCGVGFCPNCKKYVMNLEIDMVGK